MGVMDEVKNVNLSKLQANSKHPQTVSLCRTLSGLAEHCLALLEPAPNSKTVHKNLLTDFVQFYWTLSGSPRHCPEFESKPNG
jgi:hypothetical protein